MTPLDANNFQIQNLDTSNLPSGGGTPGPGGGGLTSITGDDGSATGLTLTITAPPAGSMLTDPIFTLGATLSLAHGGTGATSANGAKTAFSLDQVNNTSDADKPISTATQTALNTKATPGDITSALGAFTGSTSVVTLGTVTTGTWNATAIAAGKLPSLDAITVPGANLSLNAKKIINLADPSNALDATNKQYVDAVATGGVPHGAVNVATTANISLAGEQSIDGLTTSASRVLVKNQTAGAENGIYLSGAGGWTRATDANTGVSVSGSAFVAAGTVNGGSTWGVTTPQPITLNTTPIAYTLTGQSTIYSAGNGLSLTGSQFSLANMPTNTIKGNNAGGTGPPLDLTAGATKTLLALNNVENTALSTWAGSTSITTLGIVTAGTIPASLLSGTTAAGLAALNTADPNANAIRFPRFNADNTATTRTPALLLSDIGAESTLTFAAPLVRGAPNPANTVAIPRASNAPSPGPGTSGYIHADDFRDFSSKVPSSRTLSATAPLRINSASGAPGSDLSANRNFDMPAATVSADGYLKATDFANFAGGSAVTITAAATGTTTISASANPPVNRVILQPLTGNLNIDLPPAVNYSAGQFIELVDPTGTGVMTPTLGITVRKVGGDTVDNLPQIGLPRASTYFRFTSNGLASGGKWASTIYYANSIVDPADPNKKVTFNVSAQPSTTPPAISNVVSFATSGNSTTVVPGTASTNMLKGVDPTTGALIPATLGDIMPSTVNHGGEALFTDGTQPPTGPNFSWGKVQLPSTAFVSLDTTGDPQWNFSTQKAILVLDADKTLHISGAVNGDSRTLEIRHANNGTPFVINLPCNSLTSGGTPGLLTTTNTANSVDLYAVQYDGINDIFMWSPVMMNGIRPPPCVPLPDLLWWKFNDGTTPTATVASSSIAGGIAGTVQNASSTAWTTAVLAGFPTTAALNTPGSAGNGIVTSNTAIQYGSPVITVSFWINDVTGYDTTATAKNVFTHSNASVARWVMQCHNNKLFFRILRTGSTTAFLEYSAPAPPTGSGATGWHHFVLVLDNQSNSGHGLIKIYKDGIRQSEILSGGIPPGSGDDGCTIETDLLYTVGAPGNFVPNILTVGAANVSLRNDDLQMFSTELSPAQVIGLNTAGPQ